MCAYSVVWDASTPVGSSTNANTIDTEFQNLKTSIQERMNQILDSSTAWETDGDDPKLLDVLVLAGTPEVAVVYASGNQTVTHNVILTILWDTETLDTGSFHSTSSNTERMTITTAAYYRLTAMVAITAGAAVSQLALALRKNGSTIRIAQAPSIASDVVTLYMTEIVLAAAADYYDLAINQVSGVDATVEGGATNSMFSIERINGTT